MCRARHTTKKLTQTWLQNSQAGYFNRYTQRIIMSRSQYLPDNIQPQTKAMIFVDGENLTIRFQELLGEKQPEPHVKYLRDVFVWSRYANIAHHVNCEVIRKYYYTSVQGDDNREKEVLGILKKAGIESPIIFKKPKGRSSKRVDISLNVDMLNHAQKNHYDIAILVAGDDDYLPLVQSVKKEGKRVVLWFFEESKGLSEDLKMEADYFFDISWFLIKAHDYIKQFYHG